MRDRERESERERERARDRGREVFDEEQMRTYNKLTGDLRRLRSQPPAGSLLAMVVKEHGPQPETMHVHIRGNAGAKGDEVQPAFPQIPPG